VIPNFISTLNPTAKKTLHLEILRSCLMGVIDTGLTFFLLYLVRVVSSSDMSKSLVVAGGSVGLLLSPLIAQISSKFMIAPAKLAANLFFIGGCFSILIPFFEGNYLLSLLMAGTLATWNMVIPLTTQIYVENFPVEYRGKLFSLTMFFRFLITVLFAYLFGEMLENSLSNFQFIFFLYSSCFFLCCYFLLQIPSTKEILISTNSLVSGFEAIKFDKVFRLTIISWMFLGFGNLMLMPLRVEFLANPIYGNALTASQIAWLVSVVPNIFRLLFIFMWGVLFDKMNFFRLRIIINIGFMLGALSFFLYSSWTMLFLGAILYGISIAGGDVAWNLWVTKFAPVGKSKDYMAVHTFFTGIRGILAPILAFFLLSIVGFDTIVFFSLSLMIFACILLYKEASEK